MKAREVKRIQRHCSKVDEGQLKARIARVTAQSCHAAKKLSVEDAYSGGSGREHDVEYSRSSRPLRKRMLDQMRTAMGADVDCSPRRQSVEGAAGSLPLVHADVCEVFDYSQAEGSDIGKDCTSGKVSTKKRHDKASGTGYSARILQEDLEECRVLAQSPASRALPMHQDNPKRAGSQASPPSDPTPRLTVLARRQADMSNFDECKLDLILLVQSARIKSQNLKDLTAGTTETHTGPDVRSSPKEDSSWYKRKQTEINARLSRKARFGVRISKAIFDERKAKGWHKHQNMPD